MSDVHMRVQDHLYEAGTRLRSVLGTARRHLEGMPTLELVAPLTLVLLLLYPGKYTETHVALQVGAVAGLLYRPLWRMSGFWFALAAVMGAYCVVTWHDADNHKYLITYWCLALGLSCEAEDTSRALRINARLLVGLCFLLAVVWKLRTPDFLTGEYYQFSMLTDDRLFSVGQLFTEMTPELYFQNQDAIDQLTAYSSSEEEVLLQGASRLRPLSIVLVIWTLLVESWIFVSFLWPTSSDWAARSRYLSLLVFVATTYAAAHVGGFAWILTVLGLAAVRPAHGVWRSMYLGGLVLVILYQLRPIDKLLVWLH